MGNGTKIEESQGADERHRGKGMRRLVRGVDNVILAKTTAPSAARTLWCGGTSDTLPRWHLESTLGDHIDLVWQSNDDILVRAEPEVISHDILTITLDGVRVLAVGNNLLHTPCNDEGTGSGNDASFR